jgi:hypothetical protein
MRVGKITETGRKTTKTTVVAVAAVTEFPLVET